MKKIEYVIEFELSDEPKEAIIACHCPSVYGMQDSEYCTQYFTQEDPLRCTKCWNEEREEREA